MDYPYVKPQTLIIDFDPELTVCAASDRTGSSSDYNVDGDDLFGGV